MYGSLRSRMKFVAVGGQYLCTDMQLCGGAIAMHPKYIGKVCVLLSGSIFF